MSQGPPKGEMRRRTKKAKKQTRHNQNLGVFSGWSMVLYLGTVIGAKEIKTNKPPAYLRRMGGMRRAGWHRFSPQSKLCLEGNMNYKE